MFAMRRRRWWKGQVLTRRGGLVSARLGKGAFDTGSVDVFVAKSMPVLVYHMQAAGGRVYRRG